jgi:hypothetical protein
MNNKFLLTNLPRNTEFALLCLNVNTDSTNKHQIGLAVIGYTKISYTAHSSVENLQ